METTIRSFFDKIHRYKNNLPYYPGFLPYFEDKDYIYIFQRAEQWNATVDRENNLIINMTGPLWQFEKRTPYIVVQALNEVIKAWIPRYKKRGINVQLVEKSSFEMTRQLIINKRGLYFRDTISGKDNNFTHTIPFTFRTFGNVDIINSGEMFTIYNPSIASTVFISKESSEKILMKKKCLSSTGVVNIWELSSPPDRRRTTMERLISIKSGLGKSKESQFKELFLYFRNLLA